MNNTTPRIEIGTGNSALNRAIANRLMTKVVVAVPPALLINIFTDPDESVGHAQPSHAGYGPQRKGRGGKIRRW